MTKTDAIRVVVADDHPVVREGVCAIIDRREDMTVIGQASDGRELVDLYRQLRPDIALVDLRMPVLDGVAAIQQILAEFPDARLIVLTTYDGDEDIYRGLRAGAKAYLLKDSPREDLLEGIRAVREGRHSLPAAVAGKLAERMHSASLTARELEVLQAMAAGKSNKEIAAALFITEGTVKVHVNHILDKLGVSDRTQAVTTALKRGIVHLA